MLLFLRGKAFPLHKFYGERQTILDVCKIGPSAFCRRLQFSKWMWQFISSAVAHLWLLPLPNAFSPLQLMHFTGSRHVWAIDCSDFLCEPGFKSHSSSSTVISRMQLESLLIYCQESSPMLPHRMAQTTNLINFSSGLIRAHVRRLRYFIRIYPFVHHKSNFYVVWVKYTLWKGLAF